MAGNGVIQAELAIELGRSLAALNQAQAAIAKFAQGAGQSMAPANQAVDSLGKTFKNFRREQVQEGRLLGFYAREMGSFVGASAEVSAAAGGVAQGLIGLASATNPLLALWAAFEIGSAVVGFISGQLKETEENAKKAAAALGKVGDRLAEMDRKRLGTKQSEVEGGRVDAAKKLMAERVSAAAEAEDEGRYAAGLGDSQRLQNINDQIAAWEKTNGKLESYVALQSRVVAGLRAEEEGLVRVALAESQARGNVDYEMAGGDAGVLAVGQKLDQVRAKWEQAGAQAVLAMAKSRGASDEETDRLRLKSEMIGLNAELAAATSTAEIKATRQRIAALQEEIRLRALARKHMYDPMFGPGNAEGEQGFRDDKRDAEGIQKQNEREAGSYDAGTFDLSGVSASSVAAEKSARDAAAVQSAWQGAGMSVAGAFGQIGEAVGGAGGKMLQILGQMLAGAISVAIAYAAMAPPPWGAISMAAMAVGLIATIASAAMTPMPEGREMGGSVFPGRYLVGEAGPELLTLGNGVSGSVVPNHRLAMAGAQGGMPAGGSVTNIFNVSTVDARGFERMLDRNSKGVANFMRRERRNGRL